MDFHGDTDPADPRVLHAMRVHDIAGLEGIQAKGIELAGWLHALAADRMKAYGEAKTAQTKADDPVKIAEAKADRESAAAEVPRLAGGFNRASAEVRRTMVLKHETAGLRPMPRARVAAAPAEPRAAAPPAAAAPAQAAPPKRKYGDWRDYTDEDRARERANEEWQKAQCKIIRPALVADMLAAGRDDVTDESVLNLSRLVLTIPHPNLDACIAKLDPRFMRFLFGAALADPLAKGTGPPNAWAIYDEFADVRRAHPPTRIYNPPAAPPPPSPPP